MSRKTGNAQSRTTIFRHSAVLSLPGVLLHKVLSDNIVKVAVKIMSRRQKKTDDNLFFTITEAQYGYLPG